jgi:hypothetical protein
VERRVPLEGGQRRAQLVRGIGDEAPHPLLGGRVDVDHRVERVAEPCGLGAGWPGRDASGRVTCRDGVGGLRHRGNRPQAEAVDPPQQQPEHRRDGEPDEPEREGEATGGGVGRGGGDREDRPGTAVGQACRHDPHPPRLTGRRRAPLRHADHLSRGHDRTQAGVGRRSEHRGDHAVRRHPADPDVGEADVRRGGTGIRAGGREEDRARVLRQRRELGVDPGDEKGPLHEQDTGPSDDEHGREPCDGDDEPAAQRHGGSRTV